MNEIHPVGPIHSIVPIRHQDKPTSSKQDQESRRSKKTREESVQDDENNSPTIDEYV